MADRSPSSCIFLLGASEYSSPGIQTSLRGSRAAAFLNNADRFHRKMEAPAKAKAFAVKCEEETTIIVTDVDGMGVLSLTRLPSNPIQGGAIASTTLRVPTLRVGMMLECGLLGADPPPSGEEGQGGVFALHGWQVVYGLDAGRRRVEWSVSIKTDLTVEDTKKGLDGFHVTSVACDTSVPSEVDATSPKPRDELKTVGVGSLLRLTHYGGGHKGVPAFRSRYGGLLGQRRDDPKYSVCVHTVRPKGERKGDKRNVPVSYSKRKVLFKVPAISDFLDTFVLRITLPALPACCMWHDDVVVRLVDSIRQVVKPSGAKVKLKGQDNVRLAKLYDMWPEESNRYAGEQPAFKAKRCASKWEVVLPVMLSETICPMRSALTMMGMMSKLRFRVNLEDLRYLMTNLKSIDEGPDLLTSIQLDMDATMIDLPPKNPQEVRTQEGRVSPVQTVQTLHIPLLPVEGRVPLSLSGDVSGLVLRLIRDDYGALPGTDPTFDAKLLMEGHPILAYDFTDMVEWNWIKCGKKPPPPDPATGTRDLLFPFSKEMFHPGSPCTINTSAASERELELHFYGDPSEWRMEVKAISVNWRVMEGGVVTFA